MELDGSDVLIELPEVENGSETSVLFGDNKIVREKNLCLLGVMVLVLLHLSVIMPEFLLTEFGTEA